MKINPRPIIFILIVVTVFFIAGCADTGLFAINRPDKNADSNQADKRDLDERIDNRIENKINKGEQVDVIIEFTNRNKIDDIVRELGQDFKERTRFKYSNTVAGKINREGFNRLKSNPNIKNIILDEMVTTFLQDSVPLINADDVWNINIGGKQITGSGSVCVVDTGIDYNHPDLAQNYLGGYDFINNDADPIDDHGHGTHVAGIVAANGIIKGVAPDAKLVATKVLDYRGSGSISLATSGIEWCIDNKDIYDIKVITMSLGTSIGYRDHCDDYYPTLAGAIREGTERGIIAVAASGNSFLFNEIASPACLSDIISVGASYKSDTIAEFSNRANILDIMAPGVSIQSTSSGGGYVTKSGTSMAAPHVAGAINLILQHSNLIGRDMMLRDVRTALKSTDYIVFDPILYKNYHRVDVYQALNPNPRVLTTTSSIPVISSQEGSTHYPTLAYTAGNVGFGGENLRDWYLTNNIFHDEGYYTVNPYVYSGASTDFGDELVLRGFGFNIPSDAIINGIELRLKGHYVIDFPTFGIDNPRTYILFYKGTDQTTAYGLKSIVFGTDQDTWEVAGSPTDYWSIRSLIPADINSPDFGFNIYTRATTVSEYLISTYIDYAEVTVYYTSGSSPTTITTTTIIPVNNYNATSSPSSFTSTNIFSNDVEWSNVNNVINSDDLYASAINVGGASNTMPGTFSATSKWLNMQGFGFNIPSDAIIDGITVSAEGHNNIVSNIDNNWNNKFSIFSDELIGSVVNKRLNLVTDGYTVVGSPTNKWGQSWTPSRINSPTFGVSFRTELEFSDSIIDTYIDNVKITVSYSIPLTPTTTTTTIQQITPDCSISDVTWLKLNATEGDNVEAQIFTSGCQGQTIHFSVVEDDILDADDPAGVTNPTDLIIPSSPAIVGTSWTAEWQNDCDGLCNPPEYSIIAMINLSDGNSLVSSSSTLLKTSPGLLTTTTSTTSSSSSTITSTSTTSTTSSSSSTITSTSTTTTEQIITTGTILGDTKLPTSSTSTVIPSGTALFPSVASIDPGASGVMGWETPANILADDSAYATAGPIGASTGSTYWLIAQGFGFTIPAGSTINGIVVTLEGEYIAPSGVIYDYYRLRKNSAWAIPERLGIPLSSTAGIVITGSPTDLWSTTWTPAEINDPSFGIAYRTTSDTIDYDTGIDYMKITVYYTSPPDPTLYSLVNIINSIFSIGTAGGDDGGVVVSGGSSGGSVIVPIQTYQNGTAITSAADKKINPAVIIIAIIILVYLARKKGRR